MSEYKVVNVTELNNDLSSVADSIRAKNGTSETLTFPEGFCSAVENIETGGGAKEEQTKSLNVTANDNYDILPDNGKVLSKATVNVNVPERYDEGYSTGKQEGYSEGYQASQDSIILQEKTIDITENGTFEVSPDEGKLLSKIAINVDVSTGGGESIDGIPTGYVRVDYIQFDGSQIVDTGFIGNQNTQINTCFTREESAQKYLFGCASSDNSASITAYMGGTWRFGNKSTSKALGTIDEHISYGALVNKTKISVAGAPTTISDVNDFETIGTVLLGGCRSSNGNLPTTLFAGKVFYFVMWQGEEQVLKLIPIVSAEGQYRFFDMVSQTFFDSITDTPLEGGNL